MKQMRKMGGLGSIMNMLPGLGGMGGLGKGKMPDIDADDAEQKMARVEAIILFHDDQGTSESGHHHSAEKAKNRSRSRS